jgi:hypothetical protein
MPTPFDPLYPATEKLCSRKDCHLAGIPQPLVAFYKNPATKLGVQSACKKCMNRDKRIWGKAHPDKMAAANARKRVSQQRKEYMSSYRKRPGNAEVANLRRKRWEQANKARIRVRSLGKRFRRFGVTQTWYDETLKKQKNGCAVCGAPPSSSRRLAIDHDHRCCGYIRACDKCRRGLLCQRCNTRLGILEDADWTAKAQKYLLQFAKRS